jgi:hypothetical protein
MVTAAEYITDDTLVKRVPHRKLKCPEKEVSRLNNLIREYLPGSGLTEDTGHTFCTFNTAVVKAINKIKPICVHRSKGPARLKIHNAVRALGQILRCIQLEPMVVFQGVYTSWHCNLFGQHLGFVGRGCRHSSFSNKYPNFHSSFLFSMIDHCRH